LFVSLKGLVTGVGGIGFLVQWPTIITILMAPILLFMYTRLAKQEEKNMVSTFGEQYLEYARKVPAYLPRIFRGSLNEQNLSYNKVSS